MQKKLVGKGVRDPDKLAQNKKSMGMSKKLEEVPRRGGTTVKQAQCRERDDVIWVLSVHVLNLREWEVVCNCLDSFRGLEGF